MNIIRFSSNKGIQYGLLEGSTVKGYRGSPFQQPDGTSSQFEPDGTTYELSQINLLVPCLPTKIICLGLNYKSHILEVQAKAPKITTPEVPTLFFKPTSAIIGPEDTIVFPRVYKRMEFEGEVGVVIGKKAKEVPEEKATDYILGYTIVNDVSERGAQGSDQFWIRAKGYDTFAPIGPAIRTDLDHNNINFKTVVNGTERQSFNTNDLLFGIPYLVNYISQTMTLFPGDVISTGTSKGTGELNPGDTVEMTIEGLGTLRNYTEAKA